MLWFHVPTMTVVLSNTSNRPHNGIENSSGFCIAWSFERSLTKEYALSYVGSLNVV